MKKGLNPNLKIFNHKEYVILYNVVTKKTYKMGNAEFILLNHYVSSQRTEEFLDIISRPKVQRLISNAENESIIVTTNHVDSPPKRIVHSVPLISFSGNNYNGLTQYWKSFLLFSIVAGIFGVTVTFAFLSRYHDLIINTAQSEKNNPVAYFIVAVVSLLISSFCHEASHMIVALNKGADVPEIGIKHFLMFFWAYAKILNISGLSAIDRIRIYIAGCAANLLCGSLLWICCAFSELPSIVVNFLLLLSVTNLMQFVINLMFVFKLDGYRILCCIFGTEDIYTDIKKRFQRSDAQRRSRMIDTLVYSVFILINTFFIIFIVLSIQRNIIPKIVCVLFGGCT